MPLNSDDPKGRFRGELNPPATAAEVDVVATTLNVALPADLRIWWRLSNGVRHGIGQPRGHLIPDFLSPYPTMMALERWRELLEVQRRLPYPPQMREEMDRFVATENNQSAGSLRGGWYWLPRWLPVAGDILGGGLFVDLREGPLHGCLVEFSSEHRASTARWESVTQMWVKVADLLDAAAIDLASNGGSTDELLIGRWRPPRS